MKREPWIIERKLKKTIPADPCCDDYYRFGWEKFGPFLYGYIRWLRRSIKDSSVDQVFFLARDGFMMKQAFQLIDGDQIRCEYMYVSRKSLRQALLWRCGTYEESLRYLTRERFVTLGKLLEYYGFDEKEREEIGEKYKQNLFRDYRYDSLKECSEIRELYTELKTLIDFHSRQQDDLLFKYLQQLNLSGNCAVVDIGWHGSMQYYLEEFLSGHGADIRIHGFYVGILPSEDLRGEADGFLYDRDDQRFRKQVLCFFGGYEKLFQSMEGSVYGYKCEEDRVIPVLNSYEYKGQEKMVSCIAQWQKGAMDFIKKVRLSDPEWSDRDLAMPLVEFGKNPPMKGVKLFSFLYNTDGTKSYYVSRKSLVQYHPKELIHDLSNSVWKTGFMKSVFRLPLPYYYIYSFMRK